MSITSYLRYNLTSNGAQWTDDKADDDMPIKKLRDLKTMS